MNKLLNNYKYTFGIVSHEMFEAVEGLKKAIAEIRIEVQRM